MDNQSLIHVGTEVCTSDGKVLGRIKEIGSATFEVEQGLFFKSDYSMSFQEIARVKGDVAVLRTSSQELDAIREHGAIGTTFKERAAGVVEHAKEAVDQMVHPAHTPTPKDASRA